MPVQRKYFTVFAKPGVLGPDRTYVNTLGGNWSTGHDAINYVTACFPEFSPEQFEFEELAENDASLFFAEDIPNSK